MKKKEEQDLNWEKSDPTARKWAREKYKEFLEYKSKRSWIQKLLDKIFGSLYDGFIENMIDYYGKHNLREDGK